MLDQQRIQDDFDANLSSTLGATVVGNLKLTAQLNNALELINQQITLIDALKARCKENDRVISELQEQVAPGRKVNRGADSSHRPTSQ